MHLGNVVVVSHHVRVFEEDNSVREMAFDAMRAERVTTLVTRENDFVRAMVFDFAKRLHLFSLVNEFRVLLLLGSLVLRRNFFKHRHSFR
jgi:hypothetical protein